MLVLEEVRSLYKQKKSEEPDKLHWEYTYDGRQSVNVDLMSMYEGCIPSEAVSDIEFLTETNKQYAELGLTPKLDRLDDKYTDYNNNKNKRKSLYMDGSFHGGTSIFFEFVYSLQDRKLKHCLNFLFLIVKAHRFSLNETETAVCKQKLS